MSPTLEEVMQSKSITKYRLSKESGIPWATLSDICNGKTNLERDLPPHLDKCINDLKDAVNRKEKYIDTYLDDLYGSINSAYWDGEISEEQAGYIRDKYLGL